MAHFAIQIGAAGIDLEDEDLSAGELVKIGMPVLEDLIDLLSIEDDDEDDD